MAQINLPRPTDGSADWAPTADALLDALKNESNDQDNRLASSEGAIADLRTLIASLSGSTTSNGGGGSYSTYLQGSGIDLTGVNDSRVGVQAVLTGARDGTTVIIPDGAIIRIEGGLSVSNRITLAGSGQLNFYNLDGSGANYAIQVTAAGTVLSGVRMSNPDMTQPTTTFANGSQQYGINVKANDVKVIDCTVDKFEGGIAVDAHGEYERVHIIGNRVSDVLGAGGGASDTTTQNGEDRGDGISVWGAQVVVMGNIVNCLAGRDARIGIHHEGLPQQEAVTDAHADAEVVIANNIVYGQFRRSIATENIVRTSITGNSVADATWWGIAMTWGTNCIVSGNTIKWTRTAADNQGGSWGPNRVPILVYTQDGTAKGTRIVNNTIEIIAGAAVSGGGIRVAGDSAINPAYDGLLISGNSVIDSSGTMSSGVRILLTGLGAQIHNNNIPAFTDSGIYLQQPQGASITGNRLYGPGSGTTYGVFSNGAGAGVQVANNDIRNVTTAVYLNSLTSAYLHVNGNAFSSCTTGINLNGCVTPILINGNTYNGVTTPTAGVAAGAVITGNSNN